MRSLLAGNHVAFLVDSIGRALPAYRVEESGSRQVSPGTVVISFDRVDVDYVRHSERPSPDQNSGVQASYNYEVEVFVAEGERTIANFAAGYDLLANQVLTDAKARERETWSFSSVRSAEYDGEAETIQRSYIIDLSCTLFQDEDVK